MEKKEFKKKFPKLAEELEQGVGKAELVFEVEKPFIRRCTNDTQALEIIEYMKNREEITHEEAENLCQQLEEQSLRSFGRKKNPGHYEREG